MKAILVSMEGTICDDRERCSEEVAGEDIFHREAVLQDRPLPGSVHALRKLGERYALLYMGNRPPTALPATKEWLAQSGFPAGPVVLGEQPSEHLAAVQALLEKYDLLAGIGCTPDDNALHTELGVLSFILPVCSCDWEALPERIEQAHRAQKVRENQVSLRGKVDGLAHVCPPLLEKYGPEVWEIWLASISKEAEAACPIRRQEDLRSFAEHGLNPNDLRDVARWDMALREEGWQDDPAYGLQDFELVEASEKRYVHKITRCFYAEEWKRRGYPEIGYQVHCRTDQVFWDRPAWNPQVRFQQPQTLMQGHDSCVFILEKVD